jgi:hypothetical protein
MGGGGLMRNTYIRVRIAAAKLWWAVRQIFGDAAYENYLRNFNLRVESLQGGVTGGPPSPLSPADFYLDSLRRRYSRISRCC